MAVKGSNSKTREFRDKLVEMFISELENKDLNWKQGWGVSLHPPMNPANGTRYKGINKLHLMLCMMAKGWSDNRFMTFNQIKAKGYKLQKGASSVLVEYWMPFDFRKKKVITWMEYEEALQASRQFEEESERPKVGVVAKYYHVFNGVFIDGLPELTGAMVNDISPDELIQRISDGMGVAILNDGGDSAFYRSVEDRIHLPPVSVFLSDYDYNCTALHELGHATGAAHRLARDLSGGFGSESYAQEELVAELTSAFMGVYLKEQGAVSDLGNHAAYIQSWVKAIRNRPNVLFDAVKDAENACEFMEKSAGLNDTNSSKLQVA